QGGRERAGGRPPLARRQLPIGHRRPQLAHDLDGERRRGGPVRGERQVHAPAPQGRHKWSSILPVKWLLLSDHFAGNLASMNALPPLSVTERTRVRRHHERARTDRADLYEVLDAGMICHLAVVRDGSPVGLPTAYGRLGGT